MRSQSLCKGRKHLQKFELVFVTVLLFGSPIYRYGSCIFIWSVVLNVSRKKKHFHTADYSAKVFDRT